jgi:hypothetical protein
MVNVFESLAVLFSDYPGNFSQRNRTEHPLAAVFRHGNTGGDRFPGGSQPLSETIGLTPVNG